MDDEVPIAITIEPTTRTLEWVDLVGIRYPVRRPKSIVSGTPKTEIMRLAAYISQHTEAASPRRPRQGAAKPRTTTKPIELTAEQIQSAMTAVWRYLHVALDNPDDYADIRRRLYGDIDDNDANGVTYLEFEHDPNPSDDLDIDNVIMLVANLIAHWQETDSVRSAARAPKPPAARNQQNPGQVTRRPANKRGGGSHAKHSQHAGQG